MEKVVLPTFTWMAKNPYKSRFISNASHCSTTILSKHNNIRTYTCFNYCETAFSNSNVNFVSIKKGKNPGKSSKI